MEHNRPASAAHANAQADTGRRVRPETAPARRAKWRPRKGWDERYSVGVLPQRIPTPPLREPIPLSKMDLYASSSLPRINPLAMSAPSRRSARTHEYNILPQPKPERGSINDPAKFTSLLWESDQKARAASRNSLARAADRAAHSKERELAWNPRAAVGDLSLKNVGKRLSVMELSFYDKRHGSGLTVNSTPIFDRTYRVRRD